MEIVAVIPARANSKRIPNKNIRLLNNHPMVYYAIQNACHSQYITRVIVTTDSKEVEIIAGQLGVECILRSPELCEDDVALDAVIYDAVKDIDCEYVVTLQPTSPLLKTETLDQAIRFTMEQQLDTVISVLNHPKLSWERIEGKMVPSYDKRLNSQLLPPHYQETGAFLISKRTVVTVDSRIGEKVDVFELSREEAVNVDTFQDLELANVIFQKKRIAIYVNGNNQRGMGHIYRSLELADEFYSKPDIYFDKNQTSVKVFGNTTHKLIPVDGLNELLEKLKEKQYDVFINDILSTSIDYMIALRNCLPNGKIVNFEDDGEGIYKADLVFNALYQNHELPQVKAGEKYYIASKLFMLYQPIEIKKQVKNVIITFGGSDPQNYSDRLLNIITKNPEKYQEYHFYVVLGRAKLNVAQLMEYANYPNIDILYDIKNMPEIMSKCDIAITSRGRTGYELAILGIPTIAMAQNKREEKHGFMCHENGFNYLGLNPSDRVIETNLDLYLNLTASERKGYQETLLSKDLRNGRQRVMNLINSL